MRPNAEGVLPYKNLIDVLRQVDSIFYSLFFVDHQKRRCYWVMDWFPSILFKSRSTCHDFTIGV